MKFGEVVKKLLFHLFELSEYQTHDTVEAIEETTVWCKYSIN